MRPGQRQAAAGLSVRLVLPARAGYIDLSVHCPHPGSGDVPTATATFQLDPGETVTRTFTDDKRGTIVVQKQTQPAGAAGSFTFSGDAAGSIGDGGTITVPNLPTVGSPTYHATEADPRPNSRRPAPS